jgi:hypothetical protein
VVRAGRAASLGGLNAASARPGDPHRRLGRWIGAALFAAWTLHSAFLLSIGWHNPIGPPHGFRQTQTAIASRALLEGGPFLRYETPVLGAPWSVPFELPLYQWITAEVARATGARLEVAGRVVGVAFFALSLGLFAGILRVLDVGVEGQLLFLCMVVGSPLYLFWSRAFLIESTALFFAAAYLLAALEARRRRSGAAMGAASLLGALAGAIKATTLAPFLLVAAIDWAAAARRGPRRPGWALLLVFGAPLLATQQWIAYADRVKSENVLGRHLTSGALTTWSFGSLAQKLSPAPYLTSLGQAVPDALGHELLVVPMLAGALLCDAESRGRFAISLAAFLSAPLVFTNLYAVHNYYAYANGIFLLAAYFWVARGLARRGGAWRVAAALLVATALLAQSVAYSERYLPLQRRAGYWIIGLGEQIRARTSPHEVLVVFGLDWSPELAYFAHRRALMWADWMPAELDSEELREALRNLAGETIGALVACGDYREAEPWTEDALAVTGLRPPSATGAPIPGFEDPHCAVYAKAPR